MARRRSRQTGTCAPLAAVFLLLVVLIVLVKWILATPPVLFLLLAAVTGVSIWRIHAWRTSRERAAEYGRIRAVQSMEIGRYHAMDPGQFEEAIAYLCLRDGCHDVRVTGGAGDLGADVVATAPDGRRVIIQCKRYGPANAVGSGDLQRFGGTCYTVHGAQVAALVTTSRFTKPASGYATTMGIKLFDEQALAAWATRTGPAPWMI